MEVIQEMKLILARWGWHPKVRAAMGRALSDNNVSPEELADIRSSVALAMAHKLGGLAAFEQTCEDRGLVEEVLRIKEELGGVEDVAEELDLVLQDGKVTPEEIARLRAVADAARKVELSCPGFSLPYPKPAPDWIVRRKKKGQDGEESED